MAKLILKFDASGFRRTVREARRRLIAGAAAGVAAAASQMIEDASVDVPVLSGDLKDSGRVEADPGSLRAQAAWDVSSPEGFHYAETQHEDVLQHINGLFAARWAEKAINRRGDFYLRIIARTAEASLRGRGGA